MNKMFIILFVLGILIFFPTESQAEVTQTGTWGDVTWEFDGESGALTFTGSGTLGTYDQSPWNKETNAIIASNITKITFQQPVVAPKESDYLFSNSTAPVSKTYLTNLVSISGLSKLDTSNATSMVSMFDGCTSLASLDLSNFNTSNVHTLMGLFRNCSNLTELDLSNFNTSNVESMFNMFFNCSKLITLNLSSFDTSKVSRMDYMFSNCTNLTTINLRSLNTTNVTNMSDMFAMCTNLKSLDLSSFNTSNVTEMIFMFSNCTSLKELNLSNFDTINVTDTSYMFYRCISLESLDLSSFSPSDREGMFYEDTALSSLRLGSSIVIDGTSLPEINKTNNIFTGRWVQVSDNAPKSYESSAEFMKNYDGSSPGTYIWQRYSAIIASDYAMYIGDPVPTVNNFNASATDQYGAESEVTVDLTTANLTQAGIYPVIITSADGQMKNVTLTVLANHQIITGEDYTMYIGDPAPTITNFKASATDKKGMESAVTVDLSVADLTKTGTYSVTITSADGQSLKLKLIVLARNGTKAIQNSFESSSSKKKVDLPETGESHYWLTSVLGMVILGIGGAIRYINGKFD